MVNPKTKSDCCGCEACGQVCPRRCIDFSADGEGFLYPKVNLELCVNCGLCERVCPVINQADPVMPRSVFAAKSKLLSERMASSSGGIFPLLAKNAIARGGVVFGAAFDENLNVRHSHVETEAQLRAFSGSKYVQSRIGNSFRLAADFLKAGRFVLFSGTPCQISGLKKFLGKDYENLFALEVICHGAPSPKVFSDYLSIFSDSKPTSVYFRDKSLGWKLFSIRLCDGENHEIISESLRDNPYMQGFLKDLYLRPSCHACPAREGKSGADIILGDFWGVGNYYPEFDDDKGVSVVVVNSDKGEKYFDELDVEKIETSYEKALRGNPALKVSAKIPKLRGEFWSLYEAEGFPAVEKIVDRMRPTKLQMAIVFVKRRILFLKNAICRMARRGA